MADNMPGGPPSPRTAAREAALAEGVRRGVYNATGARKRPSSAANRKAMGEAARSAYNEIKAFLDTEECAVVGKAEKEFLALALSQLSSAELASLGQRGGSRQRGGALAQSLVNFLRTLCNRVRGAVTDADAAAAAAVDAAAVATQEQITRGVLRALPLAGAATAGSIVMSGHTSGVISLALTALKGINTLLPGPATVAVNTYSGLVAWLPVGAAAAPVAGKIFTIFLCYRAVVLTREFVGARLGEFKTAAGGIDYDGLLRELMNVLYRGIVHGVPAGARAVPRAAIAAGRGAVAGAGAALGVVDDVIDAAVTALLGPANEDAVKDLVNVAVGPDAPAPARANAGVGAGAGAVNAAVGTDEVIAAGDAAGAAGAGAAPAGLDALALMASAMPSRTNANSNSNNSNNSNNNNGNNNGNNANNNNNGNNNNGNNANNANNNGNNANNNNNGNNGNNGKNVRPTKKPKTRKQKGGKRSKPKTRKNRK